MLLKCSCTRLSRNIFSGSRWIIFSLKSHHRCLIGSLFLEWVKISQLLKSINGGVGTTKFFLLLKWFCFRATKNIFSGSRCILMFVKSHYKCLIVSLLLKWVKTSLILKSINWGVRTKNFFCYRNDLSPGSVEVYFLEDGAYMCLKRATTGVW